MDNSIKLFEGRANITMPPASSITFSFFVNEKSAKRRLARLKKKLEPFAVLYAEIINKVELLSTIELKNIVKCKYALTQTNCWWATFSVYDIVLEAAQVELKRRRLKKRTIKQTIKTK